MAETTANSNIQSFHATGAKVRHVLLLQGPSSFFFRDLGQALTRKGARVTRVAFTLGDRVYWSKSAGAVVWYRDRRKAYADWVQALIEREAVSDVVMLGDGRFYHDTVAELIRTGAIDAKLHVVEHGLIRPGLILRDPHGLGGNSQIKKDFLNSPPVPDGRLKRSRGGSFLEYAVMDVGYHVLSVTGGPLINPNYVRHSVDHPVREYAGWIRKAFTRPFRSSQRTAAQARIDGSQSKELFLFPLQLATDFQVRDHGVGEAMEDTLKRVIESFAANAASDALLVIKRHPLDNGWASWRQLTMAHAERFGVSGRVEYVDGGNLDALLERARGVVTINSTVGLTAILAGVPCHALGTSVYDIDGLTASTSLDDFWREPAAPDPKIAAAFEAFLIHEYHVSGAFDGPGSKEGAENLAALITEEPAT